MPASSVQAWQYGHQPYGGRPKLASLHRRAQITASADAKLAQQRGHVDRDCLRADEQRGRDVAIRLAGDDPGQDLPFARSQAVESGRADRPDPGSMGNIGYQGRQRSGSELFSQRRSGSELTRRGPPVAGGELGFGKAQARVRLGIGLSQGPPAIAYAVPLVNRRVGLVAPTEPEVLGPRLCHPGLDFAGPNNARHRRNELVGPLPSSCCLAASATSVSGYATVGLEPETDGAQPRGVPGIVAGHQLQASGDRSPALVVAPGPCGALRDNQPPVRANVRLTLPLAIGFHPRQQ